MIEPRRSKSQLIREYAAEHPRARPKAIASALQAQGVNVSPGVISNVLSQDKKRRLLAAVRSMPGRYASGRSTDSLKLAARLINECGGVEAALRALQAVEEIRQALEGSEAAEGESHST